MFCKQTKKKMFFFFSLLHFETAASASSIKIQKPLFGVFFQIGTLSFVSKKYILIFIVSKSEYRFHVFNFFCCFKLSDLLLGYTYKTYPFIWGTFLVVMVSFVFQDIESFKNGETFIILFNFMSLQI